MLQYYVEGDYFPFCLLSCPGKFSMNFGSHLQFPLLWILMGILRNGIVILNETESCVLKVSNIT